MGQLTLESVEDPHRDKKICAAFGGGVNSVAALVWMQLHGYTPTAILMIDPGSEWRRTVAYRDGVLAEWLDSVGFPRVTVTTRIEEGQHNPRAWRLETLRDECMRIKSLPSDSFADAVAMSRNADLTAPDVVGLLRAAPHGRRQLHVWVDEGMPVMDRELDNPIACECAL